MTQEEFFQFVEGLDSQDKGELVKEIYEDVLTPAQREQVKEIASRSEV